MQVLSIREDFTLDQKAWAFLNLIGQTPLTFSITTLDVSFLSNTGTNVIQLGTASFVPASDNTINLGAATRRWSTVISPSFDSGTTGSLSLKTNNGTTRVTISNTGQIYPATDAGAAQTAAGIFAGTGAPNNANGGNGDIYIRSDGGAGTTIYQRRAGAWVGIV